MTCLLLAMACVLTLALGGMLSGCARAGRLVDDRFVAPGRFEMLAPSSERWAISTNHRIPRDTDVVYLHKGGGALMRVRVTPLPAAAARDPLDVLAQKVFVQEAMTDDGPPELESMTRIALDDRAAIAFTGSRLERPQRWRVSLIVLRSQGYLMRLTFMATPKLFGPLSSDFGRLLRQFRVKLPGRFDPYLLDELPMGAPGPSPGNANIDRDPHKRENPGKLSRDAPLK